MHASTSKLEIAFAVCTVSGLLIVLLLLGGENARAGQVDDGLGYPGYPGYPSLYLPSILNKWEYVTATPPPTATPTSTPTATPTSTPTATATVSAYP